MAVDHQAVQLALRSRLLTLDVCSTGSTTLAATATGYTRAAITGAGTVACVSGAATFSTSQSGYVINGYTITVGGFAYTVSAFDGATTCTLTSTSGSLTFTDSAFTFTGSFIVDGFVVGQEVTPSGFATVPRSTITGVDALTLTVTDARTVEVAAAARDLTVYLPSNRAWENIAFTPTVGKPYVEEQYIPGPVSLNSLGTNGNITAEPQYNIKVYVPSNVGISADGKYADAILSLFCPSTTLTLSSGDQVFVRADVGPFRGQRTQVIDGWSCVPVTIPLRMYTGNSVATITGTATPSSPSYTLSIDSDGDYVIIVA